MAEQLPANKTQMEPPPRLQNDPAVDLRQLHEWAIRFFAKAVVQSKLLDPSTQLGEPSAFDIYTLTDPTKSTISKAQQTANQAFARSLLRTVDFVVSGTDDQAIVDIGRDLPDDQYRVLVQATGFTGSPVVGAFVVRTIQVTTAQVVVSVFTAPGSDNTVNFTAFLFPIVTVSE